MMKYLFPTALLCLCLAACNTRKEAQTETNPVTNPIPLKLGDGFEAFVSDDLVEWDSCGQVYKGGSPEQWNMDCFWAPEVYERDGKYYMFFSANYKENPTNEGENFKIGVAVS